MEETLNNCQSPSDWGSMQDLTSWSFNDHENVRNQPRTTREDLVNDLKAATNVLLYIIIFYIITKLIYVCDGAR